MDSRDLETRPNRTPITHKVLAGAVLVAVAALVIHVVIGLVMAVFWIVVAIAAVVAVLWALNTLL
jgi:uncharacterized membrane protein YgaE (UPF0421/DUF939 family)